MEKIKQAEHDRNLQLNKNSNSGNSVTKESSKPTNGNYYGMVVK
jgi:hypothetical protein